MTTWVALLRGINVGKAKRLAMADLRAIVEEAGYTRARTLLNSGNVVFDGPATDPERLGALLERAIEAHAGFHSHVVILDGDALDVVVREQRLTQADNASRLLVGFVRDPAGLDAVRDLEARDWTPEAIAVGTRAVFVWCPTGVLDSKALEALWRALGDRLTTRNWATVQKLHAMTRT